MRPTRKNMQVVGEEIVSRKAERKETGTAVERRESEIRDPVDLGTLQNPGYVTVSVGKTIPTEPFASIKIGITVTLPCDPTKSGMRKGKNRAARLAVEYLCEEIDNAMGTETE